MLSLTRKEGERVVIGKDGFLVELVVVRIGKGRVILGFEASKEVFIHRKEIFEEIQKNGKKKVD